MGGGEAGSSDVGLSSLETSMEFVVKLFGLWGLCVSESEMLGILGRRVGFVNWVLGFG